MIENVQQEAGRTIYAGVPCCGCGKEGQSVPRKRLARIVGVSWDAPDEGGTWRWLCLDCLTMIGKALAKPS